MSLINILESENEYIGVSELITFKPLCKYTAEVSYFDAKEKSVGQNSCTRARGARRGEIRKCCLHVISTFRRLTSIQHQTQVSSSWLRLLHDE